MNQAEARDLASDICDTWAITPKHRIWSEALTVMDHTDARAAYVKLRRNRHERDMTVGLFTDEYRQLRPAPPPPEQTECDWCPGDGWQTVEYDHDGKPYRGVQPCNDCTAGQRNARTYNSVIKANIDIARHAS